MSQYLIQETLQDKFICCGQMVKIVGSFLLHACKPGSSAYPLIKNSVMLFHGKRLVNMAHRKWEDKELWVLAEMFKELDCYGLS